MAFTVKIYNPIAHFLEENLERENFFCCVYGSYPLNRANLNSDIDLFIATSDSQKEKFNTIKNFILKVHNINDMKQDHEVPYENKLLVTYNDVRNAVTLNPFKRKDELYVPEIRKEPDFLSSTHIRERLLFNALSGPNDCIAGNYTKYLEFREMAEESLYKLACSLSSKNKPIVDDLVNVLLYSPSGEEGEMYLGYKDIPAVKGYLSFVLNKYHKE